MFITMCHATTPTILIQSPQLFQGFLMVEQQCYCYLSVSTNFSNPVKWGRMCRRRRRSVYAWIAFPPTPSVFYFCVALWNPIFSIWAPAKKNYLVCGRISRNCETTECHSSRKRKPTWKRGMIFVYTPQFCRKILHNTARRWREKSYYSSLFLALDLLS